MYIGRMERLCTLLYVAGESMKKMLKRADQNNQIHIRLYILLTMYILLSPIVEGIN